MVEKRIQGKNREQRRYPPFWDRFIPYFLGFIAIAILGLLSAALAVILGWFPSP